jgi:hypothetical protein
LGPSVISVCLLSPKSGLKSGCGSSPGFSPTVASCHDNASLSKISSHHKILALAYEYVNWLGIVVTVVAVRKSGPWLNVIHLPAWALGLRYHNTEGHFR